MAKKTTQPKKTKAKETEPTMELPAEEVTDAAVPAVLLSDATKETTERGEAAMLARRMAKAHGDYVAFYEEHYKVSREEAIRRSEESVWTPEQKLEQLETEPPNQITWHAFNDAMKLDPERAWARWDRMKGEARDELDSGVRGCEVMRQDSPWERARYAAVRAGFVEEWQPRGSLELALIDQMAQAYTGWMLWLQHFEALANAEVAVQQDQIERTGKYRPTQEYRVNMEDRALTTADRFQRMFLRALRALRDLRRYSPQITIHNRGQVNIGEQQVNVAK